MSSPESVLELSHVSKSFRTHRLLGRRPPVQAVVDVSLSVKPGETLGLVGESGSGKSTLGRIAVGLLPPTSGRVLHQGREVTGHQSDASAQMVFQDPYSSFDPMVTVGVSVAEPLDVRRPRLAEDARAERLRQLAALVRLPADALKRYPRELSGGQLQRLGVARALAVQPRLLVLDEPVSSLDVSTQGQIINLLSDLQETLGISYLLIAHNPVLVRHASNRIAVMYLGEIVEIGAADTVYDSPKHPYTQALLSAVLTPDPVIQRNRAKTYLTGEVPNPASPPSGCRFHTRCPFVMDICRTEVPTPFITGDATQVRCHLHEHGPGLHGASVRELSGANTADRPAV